MDSLNLARAISPVSSASLRKPRFRFPDGRENRGIIPSEYETADFDTRLASYSDDELNGRSSAEGTKAGPAAAPRPKTTKEKRMNKDDAWVDILVASGSKRLATQDAELRPRVATTSRTLGISGAAKSGAGRSDPELASMEVAQALATVRQLSPNTDDEGDHEPASAIGNGNGHSNGHGFAENDREDNEDDVPQSPPKRRLGYFDLHPDRRPANYEEPRHSGTSAQGDSSIYSEGDFEPTASIGEESQQTDGGDVESLAFASTSPIAKSKTLSSKSLRNVANVSPATQSKTASLIEIYRERECQSPSPATMQTIPTTAPLQIQKPSRLPVRSSSLPQEEKPTTIPAACDVSPELGDGHDEGDEDIESVEPIAPYVLGELGRSSPMRYVHGAPLHNVLEAEEEEE